MTEQSSRIFPKYPIYIPSKGRAEQSLTAQCLDKDGIFFYLVVEPQEHDEYAERFGNTRVLTLPFRDRGSSIPARNWIMDHAINAGHERHWQLDDNIRRFYRRKSLHRFPCRAGIALGLTERFVDRYENVAIAGLQYKKFVADRMQ